ncbi:MAG: NADP-dependent oxidoreductase [Thermaerobacter sp.]|nr:NADP-dependent oxidoreductase [Thermaerobacter sp.]
MPAHRKFVFVRRPLGMPTGDEFRLVEEPTPFPGRGQVLIHTCYMSVDPYMRGRMREGRSYAPPWQVGEAPSAGAVGQVVASEQADLPVGAIVSGTWDWSEYVVSDGRGLRLLDPSRAPMTTALGVLGMPGLTAYFGTFEVAQPRAGDTFVVSAAAGAVGAAAGQLAKKAGCRVVGIAGSRAKVDFLLQDLKFDNAVDYRAAPDLREALRTVCPDGVDIYFDNVGGAVTTAIAPLMNTHGRVAVCGQIATYNQAERQPSDFPWDLISRRLRIEGFLVGDFQPKYGEALARMEQWVRSGSLQYRETVIDGFEKMPQALLGLFEGANFGKQLVKVSDPTA